MTTCEWQDIDTAPKDGESVLLMELVSEGEDAQSQCYLVAHWNNRHEMWECDFSGKCAHTDDGLYWSHWMPLPEPPK